MSPCSQGLASCHVTRQRWSAALAPKLFGTGKLLPCHHLRMRRSSFPNYQRVGMQTCSKVPRFQPRLERRGTDCQCWHTFPPCGQALLQHLPRGRTQWHKMQTRGRWQLRPSTVTCRSAMGRVSDHQVSYYYAAVNAPCVGHKDDESQVRLGTIHFSSYTYIRSAILIC